MNEVLVNPCDRCGQPGKVATQNTPDARLLKASLLPEGICASCALSQWLQQGPLREMITKQGPEVLRDPRVRMQIYKLLFAGRSDSDGSDIRWDRVIENWALPFPRRRRQKKG